MGRVINELETEKLDKDFENSKKYLVKELIKRNILRKKPPRKCLRCCQLKIPKYPLVMTDGRVYVDPDKLCNLYENSQMSKCNWGPVSPFIRIVQ